MPRGRKISVAVGIMVAGTVIAMFFRKPANSPSTPLPRPQTTTVATSTPTSDKPSATVSSHLLSRVEPLERSWTDSPRDGDTGRTAPEPDHGRLEDDRSAAMAKVGPTNATSPAGWNSAPTDLARSSAGRGLSSSPDARLSVKPRIHKVRDGDTLSYIAEKYLGRSDRYLDVFEFNRDVLSDPDVLPIGAELKIPPLQTARLPAANLEPKNREMVPIPPGAMRRDR